MDKDIKRGINLMILGIIISLFIIFNSPTYLNAGLLYIGMGIITIGGFILWDKL